MLGGGELEPGMHDLLGAPGFWIRDREHAEKEQGEASTRPPPHSPHPSLETGT